MRDRVHGSAAYLRDHGSEPPRPMPHCSLAATTTPTSFRIRPIEESARVSAFFSSTSSSSLLALDAASEVARIHPLRGHGRRDWCMDYMPHTCACSLTLHRDHLEHQHGLVCVCSLLAAESHTLHHQCGRSSVLVRRRRRYRRLVALLHLHGWRCRARRMGKT